jgi:hypothetical protein
VGLVGSVFLGIGWLGWTLGGAADFDAFRAARQLHALIAVADARLLGLWVCACARALAAPIIHQSSRRNSVVDRWMKGRFDGAGSGVLGYVVFSVRVLSGDRALNLCTCTGTCCFRLTIRC